MIIRVSLNSTTGLKTVSADYFSCILALVSSLFPVVTVKTNNVSAK